MGTRLECTARFGYLLRVETTIKKPGLPRATLHKPVYDIKGYYWYGHGCNNRFFESLAEVDVSQLNDPIEWSRAGDLMRYLSGIYSKTEQIRYQMEQLPVRGIIERRQQSHYYWVTKEGLVWMYASYCQTRYLVNPLLSKEFACRISPEIVALDAFKAAINSIHVGLSTIYQQLNMVA
jgi:hypothetical protein